MKWLWYFDKMFVFVIHLGFGFRLVRSWIYWDIYIGNEIISFAAMAGQMRKQAEMAYASYVRKLNL